jgi:hypothetical protein
MKDFKEVKKILRNDKAMSVGYVDLMKFYKDRFHKDDESKISDFIIQNEGLSVNAFILLSETNFYKDKDILSDDFYKEMVHSLSTDLARAQGVKEVDKKLINKVGGELDVFKNISEVMDEFFKDATFKDVLQKTHGEYNKNFKRDVGVLDDALSLDGQDVLLKMANIIKQKVFYKEKDKITDFFYNGMVDDALEAVKKEFYPDEIIPYLKISQKVDVEFDTHSYDETRNEMKKAWDSAKGFYKEGKSLGSEHNPILNKNNSSEKFWNGFSPSKSFLK